MSRASGIKDLGDFIISHLQGRSPGDVMSALTYVAAEVLASPGLMQEGITIDDAMELFTKQVKRLYEALRQTKRIIVTYTGKQPDRQAAIEAMVSPMIGRIEEIEGKTCELGCVIVDLDKAPNYITELHYFPVEPEKLS